MKKKVNWPLIFILVVAANLFLTRIGTTGLAAYDDCYYAQKAKEILHSGNLMTITYGGNVAYDNPPLYMWMAALSYKIFGISEFSAILPSSVMALLSVLMVYFLGKILFCYRVGLTAAFVLALTQPFIKYSRHSMLDTTLTFLVLFSIYFFILAIKKNERFFLLWALGVSLAIYTKSLLGLFGAMIPVLWIFTTSYLVPVLKSKYFWFGSVIILFGGFSWHIYQYFLFESKFLEGHFAKLIVNQGFERQVVWQDRMHYFFVLWSYYWPWLPFFYHRFY